jgi:hypothetical protein
MESLRNRLRWGLRFSSSPTYTVNQLWPKENKNVDPTPQLLTIILFYGLQMESGTRPEETTFTERGTERCYFATWLIEDLLARGIKNVRVLSLSYDALARVWGRGGRTRDVKDIGKDLVQKLISNSRWKLYEDQRIVLVGHSFGGLVIKSLLATAHKRVTAGRIPTNEVTAATDSQCNGFLNNVRRIFFYGVPHLGTNIALYVSNLHNYVLGLRLSGIIKNLEPFQEKMQKLSERFEAAKKSLNFSVYAFAETHTYMKVKLWTK